MKENNQVLEKLISFINDFSDCELKNFNLCYDFLKKLDDKGRQSHHGLIHCLDVLLNALNIIKYDSIRIDKSLVIIVAMLHDAQDHKFNDCSDKEINELYKLLSINKNDLEMIPFLCESISYSKQKKYGDKWYCESSEYQLKNNSKHLGAINSKYDIIRNIVSDADKLEALGENGGKRCLQYAIDINIENPIDDLIENCNSKLFKMITKKYFCTNYGLQQAKLLVIELRIYLNNIIKKKKIFDKMFKI